MSPYDIFGHSYYYFCPPSSFLCISLPLAPYSSPLFFPLSPADHVYLAILLPITSPLSPPNGLFFFTFLVSAVIPGYTLTSEDLELGASNERTHTVVFLGLGPFNHSSLV